MIRVSEIFGPTVQGEGPLIGKPTVFVRTGGCDYRCRWCDTLYAVLPELSNQWSPMAPAEILDRVKELTKGAPILITLSGGNPAMHDLGPLIDLGHSQDFRFSLETQGSLARDWFSKLDWLFLSPKPPSSGEQTDWNKFDECLGKAAPANIALKITLFDDADYRFAKSAAARYPDLPLYLQVGNPAYLEDDKKTDNNSEELMARYRWLVEKVAEDQWFEPTLLPQLHVLTWGMKPGH